MPQPSWICLFNELDLYCVRTEIWRRPELRQLLSVKSMMRNLPPKVTADLDRYLVKGCSLSPVPPAITSASTLSPAITTIKVPTNLLALYQISGQPQMHSTFLAEAAQMSVSCIFA